MTKAIIETKSGLKISIDGNSSDITDIIEDLQSREKRREERMEMFRRMREREKEIREKRNSIVHGTSASITDLLKKTIKEGFFDKPKIFRDVIDHLEKQGIRVPSSTLHPLLSRLVVMSELKRNRREDNLWEYVKK